MTPTKLHSSKPWFFLTALLALVPVLNNKYPGAFFPAIPPGLIELLTVFGGALAAAMGFTRAWAIAQRRGKAKALLGSVLEGIRADEKVEENDLGQSGRLITRLVRNVEVDLEEMKPDLTLRSWPRLWGVIPELLSEIADEEAARIRLGIVGVYMGETLCREKGWQWDFRAQPSQRQFTYLASRLTRGGRTLEIFQWAGKIMMGQVDRKDLVREAE